MQAHDTGEISFFKDSIRKELYVPIHDDNADIYQEINVIQVML